LVTQVFDTKLCLLQNSKLQKTNAQWLHTPATR